MDELIDKSFNMEKEFSEELQTAIGNVNLIMDILTTGTDLTIIYTAAILKEVIDKKISLNEDTKRIGELGLLYIEMKDLAESI
jgi:hypothetical protein